MYQTQPNGLFHYVQLATKFLVVILASLVSQHIFTSKASKPAYQHDKATLDCLCHACM